MEPTQKPSPTLLLIPLLFLVLLFVFSTYTFLHESGHALIGLLFGQSLTEFDASFWDLSAHVGLAGGVLSQGQLAIRSAAGAGLPLVVWAIFICLAPRKTTFTLGALKLISSLAVLNTLLPWMVLPVLFLVGQAPSDDVTNFLRYSQVQPLALVFIALLLYAGGWWLFLSRVGGLQNALLFFRPPDGQLLGAGTRRVFGVMAGILVFCSLVVFAVNGIAAKDPAARYAPPQDFVPVAEADLSTRPYDAETVAQFTLDEPGYVGVFVVVHGIDTTYFDLTVTGPDGYHSVVLHGEGYKADQDGGLWEDDLLPGSYQLVINSHQSPGTVSMFLKTP